jgi:hypothetical protein
MAVHLNANHCARSRQPQDLKNGTAGRIFEERSRKRHGIERFGGAGDRGSMGIAAEMPDRNAARQMRVERQHHCAATAGK